MSYYALINSNIKSVVAAWPTLRDAARARELNEQKTKEIINYGKTQRAGGVSIGQFYKNLKATHISDLNKHLDFFIGFAFRLGYHPEDLRAFLFKSIEPYFRTGGDHARLTKHFNRVSILLAAANIPAHISKGILRYKVDSLEINRVTINGFVPLYTFSVNNVVQEAFWSLSAGVATDPMLLMYEKHAPSISGFSEFPAVTVQNLIACEANAVHFKLSLGEYVVTKTLAFTELGNLNIGGMSLSDCSQQAFQAAQQTVDAVAAFAESAWNEICSWFS